MGGEELKAILQRDGVKLRELANNLGFESDQRLHSALKAKDVSSSLIVKIAKATNKSVGYYLDASSESVGASEHPSAVACVVDTRDDRPLAPVETEGDSSDTVEPTDSVPLVSTNYVAYMCLKQNNKLADTCSLLVNHHRELTNIILNNSTMLNTCYERLLASYDELCSIHEEHERESFELLKNGEKVMAGLQQTLEEETRELKLVAEDNQKKLMESVRNISNPSTL